MITCIYVSIAMVSFLLFFPSSSVSFIPNVDCFSWESNFIYFFYFSLSFFIEFIYVRWMQGQSTIISIVLGSISCASSNFNYPCSSFSLSFSLSTEMEKNNYFSFNLSFSFLYFFCLVPRWLQQWESADIQCWIFEL